MKRQSVILSLVMGAMALFASACHTTTVVVTNPDPVRTAWYNVYGYVCGYDHPTAGCNFYADGAKIVAGEDEYYYAGPEAGGLEFDLWGYYDSYGYYTEYYGWAWLSPTGILYDEFGYALNETGEDEGRDLVAQMAMLENKKVEAAGHKLAEKFALAEDTGVQIAKTLQDWATLGRKRERTDADKAEFAKRLFGVDMTDAKDALKNAESGDLSKLEAVNSEVARHWGTSPETSKAILKTWYAQDSE